MYDPLHIAPLGQEKTRGYVIYFFFIFYNHYAPDGALNEITLLVAGSGMILRISKG